MDLEDEELEAQMLNLRFCIAYWELALLLPVDGEGNDDALSWRRRVFREELAGFHQLVVNCVTRDDVMAHARASLRLAWQDCGLQPDVVAIENWARVASEDARVGVLNDLQLVAPGIYIGSTDTLAFTELLHERHIQHLVYCTTTQQETRLSLNEGGGHVVELFELPRQQFEDLVARADGVEQLTSLSAASCTAMTRIACSLSSLKGVLLYCDSGVSTSIAMCAVLLTTQYKLPLELVMSLIRAARRDISPSKHLRFQLELLS
ncbi:hypothetical protein PF005_g9766 [Phytophthora fragariae]|uniref:Tyrosine-protein phosphatase domain-containing protein n=1 Tax=Phytophthora fragariae TaxID=53985 RepID=A0A6A3F4E9_9STRA|nr:hypothetical protein PF003_g2148 [Phytophthora fragariae]KAE8938630.1 hypothetical protein PF009_g11488 [Phytophthora fragariae]KAE9005427.1 hypothetical protein PF011_g12039 [Phytophthora fragariae]KAE9106317.1 hypothetical protein PF010_g12671 [Phytophthora fragariae]KAE9106538.1 hypothetical protein PF007_g13359 [Phytophthora fragariae]